MTFHYISVKFICTCGMYIYVCGNISWSQPCSVFYSLIKVKVFSLKELAELIRDLEIQLINISSQRLVKQILTKDRGYF